MVRASSEGGGVHDQSLDPSGRAPAQGARITDAPPLVGPGHRRGTPRRRRLYPGAGGMSSDLRLRVLGMLAGLGAALCFSSMDVLFKFLSGDYPLYQLVAIRSAVALVVLLVLMVPLEGGPQVLRTRKPGLHLARCGLVLIANLSFFSGLALMPLAEAVAISFAAPMIITLLSAFFLKEPVGPWRWGAVVAGLAGVLIVMRPGVASFQLAGLLPLIGACGYAGVHVLTRAAGGTERAAALSFYPTIGFLLVSLLVGLTLGDGRLASDGGPALEFVLRAWRWPAPGDWIYIVGIGFFGAFGGYLSSQAYRLCEATLIAPLEYIGVPIAVFWGVLVFQEWPDVPVWLGSGLIVGAGLVSLWRETLRSRPASRPRPRG